METSLPSGKALFVPLAVMELAWLVFLAWLAWRA